MKSETIKKILKLIFKVGVSAAAIALVFSKIDIHSTLSTISSADWRWLVGALFIYASSQALSAMRLNTVFATLPLQVDTFVNMRLYWLGMFYNFFLPGGVGGDGYKIYYLHRHYNQPVKQLFSAIIADRLSGLIAISCYMIVFISVLGSSFSIPYSYCFMLLIPLAIVGYRIFLHFFARYAIVSRFRILNYALIVQGLQMFTAMFILFALGEDDNVVEYMFLFFASSIASAIPISMGGIGLRELTFVLGSQYLNTNEHIAVSLSILFYVSSLVSSLPGAIFALRTSLIGGNKKASMNQTTSINVSYNPQKTMKKRQTLLGALIVVALASTSCTTKQTTQAEMPTYGNPYMPLWEHIPDGEPYVFEDPDNKGHYRVYVYGSHDSMIDGYCGREQVVWSASVDSLPVWRYDGEIFKVDKNGNGEPQEKADVLYAPDVTLAIAPDGTKTYYLFPNNQESGRNGMVAKSNRPDGPFEVCNWNASDPNRTDGILKFDPAVFIDDDGRVYGYWGFGHSNAAELDPSTMATVKPGCNIVENMIGGFQDEDDNIFRFFEASSIRKIKDKYVFIYSRFTTDGEFGLPSSNYTLAYAYSNSPLGPFTYGGTIIDGRGREKDANGNVIASATPDGNTHGSICEINGQWYVFYHRQSGLNEFARQAMVAPITVNVEEGENGKVEISEAEYTSEGFALQGLNPYEKHSAGIACWYTGPQRAIHRWPNNEYFGSYIEAQYGTETNFSEPYDMKNNINTIVNNTDGSIVGYKYFNLSKTYGKSDVKLKLNLKPLGVDATIGIYIDRPWTEAGGKLMGNIELRADMPQQPTQMEVTVSNIGQLQGKHALFFVFSSQTKETSICDLYDLVFE